MQITTAMVGAAAQIVVQAAVAVLAKPPNVVSLEPHTLDQVLQSVLDVGRLAGVEEVKPKPPKPKPKPAAPPEAAVQEPVRQ